MGYKTYKVSIKDMKYIWPILWYRLNLLSLI